MDATGECADHIGAADSSRPILQAKAWKAKPRDASACASATLGAVRDAVSDAIFLFIRHLRYKSFRLGIGRSPVAGTSSISCPE